MINHLEHKAFIDFFSNVKKLAILNQCYELAAASRDFERTLINNQNDITDSQKMFENAKYLVDTYPQNNSVRPFLENYLNQLHHVVMRSEVRSVIISKILGEDEK
jgi:hypothetical protein